MQPKTGSHNFPGNLSYDLLNTTAVVKGSPTESLRLLEVWGLEYYRWLTIDNAQKVKTLVYDITSANANPFEIEAFRRRISYLKLNNSFDIQINNASPVQLYTIQDLLNRPANELIIKEFENRTAFDVPGRLEKDFQAFLFGESIQRASTGAIDYSLIYRRLGILGFDFINLKNNYKLIREFPTGVFNELEIEAKRILPTYWIDIVSFNKYGALAIIELKLNDTKLDVVSQLLDYALFACCYKVQLIKVIENHIGKEFSSGRMEMLPISCYVANNYFHPRFDGVSKFYSPKNAAFKFELKKITIGETMCI